MRKNRKLKRGGTENGKHVKTQQRVDISRVTIPPASKVNAEFMKVDDNIQKRHIEAFNRLADR